MSLPLSLSLLLSLSLSLYTTSICIFYLDLSCLVLSWLALPWCEWTSITTVIIGMTLYELALHYHIISYHILCSFILSLLLIWSPFYSILFYFISNQFDLIWFFFILLNSIYYIVQHSISYNVMPIITIVILVHSHKGKARQGKTRQDKTWWNIHRTVAYNDNDNDNDNHYSMNSHGMKIIS